MKKAFSKLDDLGVAYEFFDYKKQSLDTATLQNWVEKAGLDKILNKKGTTWRKISDDDKQKTETDSNFAIDLMLANPSMIKRPVVIQGVRLLVGFDESEFDKLS